MSRAEPMLRPPLVPRPPPRSLVRYVRDADRPARGGSEAEPRPRPRRVHGRGGNRSTPTGWGPPRGLTRLPGYAACRGADPGTGAGAAPPRVTPSAPLLRQVQGGDHPGTVSGPSSSTSLITCNDPAQTSPEGRGSGPLDCRRGVPCPRDVAFLRVAQDLVDSVHSLQGADVSGGRWHRHGRNTRHGTMVAACGSAQMRAPAAVTTAGCRSEARPLPPARRAVRTRWPPAAPGPGRRGPPRRGRPARAHRRARRPR